MKRNQFNNRLIWPAALVIGIAAGHATIVFYLLIDWFHWLFFGAGGETTLVEAVRALPAWQVIGAPAAGGLLVGILLTLLVRIERPMSIADVIAANDREGGRLPFGPSLGSAFVSSISLGSGASAGLEGPDVHLGASFGSLGARLLNLPRRTTRILMACGVSAAVAALFNAPIAGFLFAHEVILRHYAVRSFAPIATASVAGAVVSRLHLGDTPAFVVPEHQLVSYLELPAFVALGLAAAAVAIAFVQTAKGALWLAAQVDVPLWMRPPAGGLVLGVMALWVPEILGPGDEVITDTLLETFPLWVLLGLIAAKIIATAVTVASRFGGGVFGPSLYLGALAGGAVGIAIDGLFPAQTSSYGFYAIVGMGAVAAAVLRAPISTSVIVFELTADYAMTIALLVSAAVATAANQSYMRMSFFEWQLLMRDIDIREGTYTSVRHTIRVADFMERLGAPYDLEDEQTPRLYPESSLDTTLTRMDKYSVEVLQVVERTAPQTVIGIVTYTRALEIYNKGLVETNIEEH